MQDNQQWWAVAVAGTVQTSVDIGAGLVDVPRFGEGVAEGGVKGVGKDVLRLLMLQGRLGAPAELHRSYLTPLFALVTTDRLQFFILQRPLWSSGSDASVIVALA